MNPRTFKIIEEVSSQGIWSWLEIDNLSNSLYLEFQNLKLLEDMVIWGDDYNGNLAIRFGDNLSLTIFYNNVSDCKFLKFKEEELEDLFSSDIQIIDKLDYFYREFSKDICKLKFQDYEYLEELSVNFKNKKVLIIGFARSGYEAAKVLIKKGNIVVLNDFKERDKQEEDKVVELENMGVKFVFGGHPDDLLDSSFDYVIKNPGVPIDHKYVLKAHELGIEVINEVELAFRILDKKIKLIGITGTNGKTTTTTLIYEMLKKEKEDLQTSLQDEKISKNITKRLDKYVLICYIIIEQGLAFRLSIRWKNSQR